MDGWWIFSSTGSFMSGCCFILFFANLALAIEWQIRSVHEDQDFYVKYGRERRSCEEISNASRWHARHMALSIIFGIAGFVFGAPQWMG